MSKYKTRFKITGREATLEARGQEARTINALVAAGPNGVTAQEVSTWALRLAAYVLSLKRKGVSIEMVRETHKGAGGDGWHGRYRLTAPVQIIEAITPDSEAAAVAA